MAFLDGYLSEGFFKETLLLPPHLNLENFIFIHLIHSSGPEPGGGRIVIKNIVSDLIAHAAVFQKAGLPDLRLSKIKFFLNGHYTTPVIAFRIAVWFALVRYCSRERSSSGGVIRKSFLFSVVTSPASHSARV